METLGEYVRRIRKLRGMSLEEVADRLGVNFSTLSKKEKQNGPWKESDLGKLSEALGVSISTLRAVRANDIASQESPKNSLREPTRMGSLTRLVRVPVLGRAPAGPTREAVMEASDFVTVPGGDVSLDFAIRVDGDSMAPTVGDGDLLVCRRLDPYENAVPLAVGDGVVVTLDDSESAIYRWAKVDGARVYLAKDNPTYRGQWIDRERIVGLAKVMHVLRGWR